MEDTPQPAAKFWFAVCEDVFDHEVVGANVRTPKAATPSRHAWQPLTVWLWLVSEAAHKPRKRLIANQMVYLRRGQIACSFRYLADKANWGVKATRLFLERLAAFDMIALSGAQDVDQLPLNFPGEKLNGIQKGTPISVITICNYDKYQHAPPTKGTATAQQGHSRGTAGAQNPTSNTSRHEESPQPPKGAKNYWQGVLNPRALGDIQFVDGELTLINGTKTRWLSECGGDERWLGLTLKEIAGSLRQNAPHSIAAQVESKLAGKCRDRLERDERYRNAGGGKPKNNTDSASQMLAILNTREEQRA